MNMADMTKRAFDPSALELFIHRVSESSRQIISEIEKLDLFLGAERRTVMPEDVERMVPLTRTGVIFEISRADLPERVGAFDAACDRVALDRPFDRHPRISPAECPHRVDNDRALPITVRVP